MYSYKNNKQSFVAVVFVVVIVIVVFVFSCDFKTLKKLYITRLKSLKIELYMNHYQSIFGLMPL